MIVADEGNSMQKELQFRMTERNLTNWDDVRLFLAVLRTGSFFAAAERLDTDPTTVGRRIRKMERGLGVELFERGRRGVRPTGAARLIRASAEAVEAEVAGIARGAAGIDMERRGVVRITASEGVGSLWLGPRILAFQRANPGIEIYIDSTAALRDLEKGEADIAIRYGRPEASSPRARKLADVGFRAFASRAYLREYGMPREVADFRDHQFVEYDRPLTGRLWENWRRIVESGRGVVFSSNASHAAGCACNSGFGIALLPLFATELHNDIVEIPVTIGPPMELWTLTGEATGGTARVRAALDYIHNLFEIDRYRFFSA